MTGRGGRGEAIKRLLMNGADGDARVGTPREAPTGRGALKAAMMECRPYQQEASPSSSDVSAPVNGICTGRGVLMAALKMSKINENGIAASTSETRNSSGRLPPTQQFSEIRIKEPAVEKPPIIMRGENGFRVMATSNYIQIKVEPDRGMFEYEVRFDPDIDAGKLKFDLLKEHYNVIGTTNNFDGCVLYLPFMLEEQNTVLHSSHSVDGKSVTIKIIYKRKRSMSENIHFYNVLFKRIMHKLGMTRFGRHHFNPKAALQIPQHKLEVWPGYITAVDEYEGGIQLCLDSHYRILRTSTVHHILEGILSTTNGCKDWKNLLSNAVIGTSVLTKYNNHMYRVDDIDFNKNPMSEFSRNGQQMTFKDYYKHHQNLDIRDLQQPLLVSKLKRRTQQGTEIQYICLIPELCYMTGYTDAMRADFKVMKDIATCTRVSPNERQFEIKKFINSIFENKNALELLNNWGLQLQRKTVELDTRIVDSESVCFGNNFSTKIGPEANWNRQATTCNMLSVIPLYKWIIIYTNRDTTCANEFGQKMIELAGKMGMTVKTPTLLGLKDDRPETYLRAIRENMFDGLQLVVTIFPTAREDRYSAVKKLCCVERPIPSQVINSRTICNPRNPSKTNSCIQKIALQINCKLGGALWSIRVPFKNAMICGIDSYHEALHRGHSVGGFVASLNQSLTRWFSRVSFQKAGQEFIDGLKASMLCALKKYYEINNTFPDTIIIYRDGVGDGQLNVCSDYEVPQLQRTMRSIAEDYIPQIAMIVTQKRINSRIFSMSGGNNYANPQPGTVVDHTITRRNYYDFFLVSQHVREGTVTPTHYIVVYNSTKLEPDHIQRLTYKMCHLYYNWPGTIRVPAPCQYAHKLAYLVGQNIHRQPSDVLADKLYYL